MAQEGIDVYQSAPNNPGGYRVFEENDSNHVDVDFWGRPTLQSETWRVEGLRINYNYRTCDLDFTGTGRGDRIQGCRNSDDTIEGNGGRDFLFGDDGRDRIDGGSGSDKIYGEESDDRLDGGAGDNTVEGGRGRDVILVRNAPADGDLDTVQGGRDTDAFQFFRGSASSLTDYTMGEDLVWRDGSSRASDVAIAVGLTRTTAISISSGLA